MLAKALQSQAGRFYVSHANDLQILRQHRHRVESRVIVRQNYLPPLSLCYTLNMAAAPAESSELLINGLIARHSALREAGVNGDSVLDGAALGLSMALPYCRYLAAAV